MEQVAPPPRKFTVAEYIALEDAAEERHEYCDGDIIAMAGILPDHDRIVRNLSRRLSEALDSSSCENFGENQRVRVDRDRYCYPDQTVACHPLIFTDNSIMLTNPRVIFEVRSESTAKPDRGEKFYRYMQNDSLQEYVLVAQHVPRVETFYPHPEGIWAIGGMIEGLESVVRLRSLNVDLKMSQIYDRIDFPPLPKDESGCVTLPAGQS